MQQSERLMKWMLRLYPPLFFQRIWVIRFLDGFYGAEVKISKSLLNKNYNGAIFGGSTFAAADPFYPILFYQVLSRRGLKIMVWSRSSAVRYHKPAKTTLRFKITITNSEIDNCEEQLNLHGKFRGSFLTEMFDKGGNLCVSVLSEIYIRNLHHADTLDEPVATEQTE